MKRPPPEEPPVGRPPTDAAAATRQRFVDAAVAYLLGELEPGGADEKRRPTSARGGAGRRDDQPPSPDTLGIRLVAQLTGVTHAAPLYYFPDRTCLVAALAVEGFRRLGGELKRGGASRGRIPRLPGVLEDAFRYVQWAGAHPALFTTMYDPELAPDLELLQQARLEGTPAVSALAERYGGAPRAVGRRAEAFEELFAAKVALLAHFSRGVSEAAAAGALRSDVPIERVVYALTSMADGLAWQRISESQGSASLRDRHARACLQLLLQGLAGTSS